MWGREKNTLETLKQIHKAIKVWGYKRTKIADEILARIVEGIEIDGRIYGIILNLKMLDNWRVFNMIITLIKGEITAMKRAGVSETAKKIEVGNNKFNQLVQKDKDAPHPCKFEIQRC